MVKGALTSVSCFTSCMKILFLLIVDGDEGGGDTGGDGCIIWIIDYLLKQICPAHLICCRCLYPPQSSERIYGSGEGG